ncbi:hypothetical protein K474DRAFT_399569 [Panus rudis PR-1116 ss-1]|nr:hypothetical protein K474DRAFT_399569 [Panus rudis PR-1116 ss-1]
MRRKVMVCEHDRRFCMSHSPRSSCFLDSIYLGSSSDLFRSRLRGSDNPSQRNTTEICTGNGQSKAPCVVGDGSQNSVACASQSDTMKLDKLDVRGMSQIRWPYHMDLLTMRIWTLFIISKPSGRYHTDRVIIQWESSDRSSGVFIGQCIR